MSRLEFFYVIGQFVKSRAPRVDTKRYDGGRGREKLLFEIEKRKRFLQFSPLPKKFFFMTMLSISLIFQNKLSKNSVNQAKKEHFDFAH